MAQHGTETTKLEVFEVKLPYYQIAQYQHAGGMRAVIQVLNLY